MINSVAEINMVTFWDNFFHYWGCGSYFKSERDVCIVTRTGKYTVFHFVINNLINLIKIKFYVTESLLYHSKKTL